MFDNLFSLAGHNLTAAGLLVVFGALIAALSLGPPSAGNLRARGLLGR